MSEIEVAQDDSKLGAGLTCFVISPIGSKFLPLGTESRTTYENSVVMWEQVFEAACNQFGLTPTRSDKIAEPGEITEQIFKLLRDADIVIADVTGGNPNVMYELGVRHTRDKVTVQLGEHGRLPFDINTIRTIQFQRTEAGLIEARNNLIDTLRDGLAGNYSPVTATRVWNKLAPEPGEPASYGPESAALDPNSSEVEPDVPGFIDVLAEGEEGTTDIGVRLDAAAKLIEIIGEVVSSAAADLNAPDQQAKGFAHRLQVARKLAQDLDQPASDLEIEINGFATSINSVDAATQYILGVLAEDPEQLEGSREYLTAITGLADVAEGTTAAVTEMMHNSRDLQKVAKDLKQVGNKISGALSQYLRGVAIIVSWRAKVQELPS
ncbi:hypothetical protein F1D05_22000 [Kribbella qitaiheensis]|uniref:Uncharacterized protein n=1 Tax=Kribbella qitaiheensis TaxID=1544730 RepID=A0A7G6X1I1_9ACTN|nr:hypothetical protein [Kribbella qitaiheensis]QNE20096.1 hypothetical protein F1D05_22000 [Kribbella qitaiheensis]